jgi:hypothetical protein
MKSLLAILTLVASVNTFAFTSCSTTQLTSSGLPAFSVNIYHTDKIQALITDRRVSNIPKAYICQKSSMTNDGSQLSAYSCLGGGYNQEAEIAIFVNETALLANYQDASNEDNDLEDLKCEIE